MKARLSTMLLVLGAVTLSHHSAGDEPQSKVKSGELVVDRPTLIQPRI